MAEPDIKQHILIVEESATLRYMLSRTIQNQGFEITVEKTFHSALRALEKTTSIIHAIIIGWPNTNNYTHANNFLVQLDCVPFNEVPVVMLANIAEHALLNWSTPRKRTALITWENYNETISSLQLMLNTEHSQPATEPDVEDETNNLARILFVDDSKSLRSHYQRMLERHNYHVITAGSVDEAYALALENTIDIAVVDYFMPEKNGYVLCQMLRDNPETNSIRTAVITGTYLDSVIKDCLQAGAIECMFKNESEELFLARLTSIHRFIEVQRAVEKERENLVAILESVGEGVYGVDKTGRLTFINSAAKKLLGVTNSKKLLGQLASPTFHANKRHLGRDKLKESYFSGQKLKAWETIFRQKSGKEIPVDCTSHPLKFDGELQGSVIAFRDISERKMLEGKLRWQATHDHLTGLHNRRYFEGALEKELEIVKLTETASAMVYVDLDRFKYINDTAGHEVGDKILVELSTVLGKHLRKLDTIARIGGDEFGLILKKVDDKIALKITDQIRLSLSNMNLVHESKSYQINASFGIAILQTTDNTAGEVMANADIACHISKRMGRNQTHLYAKESDERSIMGAELGWSTRLKEAIKNDDFCLFFQPIIHTDDVDVQNLPAIDGALWQQHLQAKDKTYNYEVLVRMRDENGEIHFPDSFIPTAERLNMMMDIDIWILENTLKQYIANKKIHDAKLGEDEEVDIHFSINLSGNTINGDNAYETIIKLIKQYNVSPSILTFEITETCAISNFEQANDFIYKLRQLGCQFSLDDFGSGFCSFSQLKNLITDYVKIDGQFVKSMARGTTDRAIVTAMNDVAHSLGRLTVAEYVENPEILRLLKVCGVDKLQGNYISVPLEHLPVHGKA